MRKRDPRPAPRRRRKYQLGPHLDKRGKRYWAYLPGTERPRRSLFTSDERVARERLEAHLSGRTPSRALGAEEWPLAAIADAYLQAPHGWTARTLASCELRAESFVAAMEARGVRLPSEITDAILNEWRTARMATVARATINRDEVVARRMLAWASHPDRAMCGPTPLAGRPQLREPKRDAPPIIPSPREVARVVGALVARAEASEREANQRAADKLRAAMAALDAQAARGAALALASLLASGVRLDELRHLTAADLHDGAVHVRPEVAPAAEAWTTKGYRARAIPIGESSLAVVREFLRWRAQGRGGKGKPPGVSDTWVADWIDAGCAATGVPEFRAHDLRRTFCTENRRAGIPITVLRDWMGHRDSQTTERYLGRYRDDAALQAATSPALSVFEQPPAGVVPLKRKGT